MFIASGRSLRKTEVRTGKIWSPAEIAPEIRILAILFWEKPFMYKHTLTMYLI